MVLYLQIFSAKLSFFQTVSLDILIAEKKCSKYNIQKFTMLFLQQGKLHARKKRLFLVSAKIKMRGGIKVYSFKSVQLSHRLSGTKSRLNLNIKSR